MMADSLQGPYLYRLLHGYQLIQVQLLHAQIPRLSYHPQSQIAALYIATFTSSMLFGPMLGGLADKYGRRQVWLFHSWLWTNADSHSLPSCTASPRAQLVCC
jgi:MFS family permease